jgi:ATP adenylyltransferase/5',5'''-P-1,P-4-tetraphosphate phosphorylase II
MPQSIQVSRWNFSFASVVVPSSDEDDDVYLSKNYNMWVTKFTLCIVSRINTQTQSNTDMNTGKIKDLEI